ncbi:phosphate starvation-inducible protein [Vibrio phage vB_VmeM-Yong XC32]|nr:phosphate starvation-inducible protein [Vibrio phage vB_VmeM-Yong XC31]QAX96608.1 phosphate starvation-inducible protein [Vibrio phage vB_VmeM-Yong XC32]QAX96926.1 phosphate starvation-inducible protein [Vibrio phage vB_VmeM-Yong MS31]QAX97231.1 phosphate starvation-inducible protein [Vibrio phage vB_VmeM-Yong MS32]
MAKNSAYIDLNDEAYERFDVRDIYGQDDSFIDRVSYVFNVVVEVNGKVTFRGQHAHLAREVYLDLYAEKIRGEEITKALFESVLENRRKMLDFGEQMPTIRAGKRNYTAKSPNQAAYMDSLRKNILNFGIGPAGTGKTLLGVAQAISDLKDNETQIDRIIIARPAVEAGEKLGFLPGGLEEKVDPYLRPIFDAMFEMLGIEEVEKLIESKTIEVAAIGFLRGRTLSHSYVLLDETQNTTVEQAKMLITRLGPESKMTFTGDLGQIDLPKGTKSGLEYLQEKLQDISPSAHFHILEAADCQRHPVVEEVLTHLD